MSLVRSRIRSVSLSNHPQHVEQQAPDRVVGLLNRPAQVQTNLSLRELVRANMASSLQMGRPEAMPRHSDRHKAIYRNRDTHSSPRTAFRLLRNGIPK